MNDPVVNFVNPLYLKIFGATYACLSTDEGREAFDLVKNALADVDEKMINQLLSTVDWRPRLTGSWLCGVKGWSRFADQIGDLLVESKLCYAGSGYAFALANFADKKSINYLRRYLDLYW